MRTPYLARKEAGMLLKRQLFLIAFVLFFVCGISPGAFSMRRTAERNPRSDPTPLYARRLVSDADHTTFLKDVLKTATHEVMISSYTVSLKRLLSDAIITAARRGVKVYVYYENRPWYEGKDYQDFSRITSCCERFEDNANHSKCVTKDKDLVAIGSYNWLSDAREGATNASIVASGLLTLGLINDVWKGIHFYQSLKYDNIRGMQNFLSDRDAFSTGAYQFAPGQFLYTLRTPEAHGLLLEEVFEKAKERILLFSPFIRFKKLQATFTPELLHTLQHKGVHITLLMLPSPCDRAPGEQTKVFALLNELRKFHSNFSYRTQENLHAKTLLADHDLICEGSFNWLSAVTELDHEANNFEMSVAVRGEIAKELIQAFQKIEFQETEMGKTALKQEKKQTEMSEHASKATKRKDLPLSDASSSEQKRPHVQHQNNATPLTPSTLFDDVSDFDFLETFEQFEKQEKPPAS